MTEVDASWTQPSASAASSCLVFHLDDVRYALPVHDVAELLPAVTSVPVAGAPPVVEGLLNVRGELVPLLDLRRRLGLPARPVHPDDHIVVCSTGRRRVAVRVDRAEELIDCTSPAEPPDFPIDDSCLGGVRRLPDGILLVCDTSAFLSLEDSLALDAALDAEPARP